MFVQTTTDGYLCSSHFFGFWAQCCYEHRCWPHHSFFHLPGIPCLKDLAQTVPFAWTVLPQGIHIAHSSLPSGLSSNCAYSQPTPSPLLNPVTWPSPSPLSFFYSIHHFPTYHIIYLLSIYVLSRVYVSPAPGGRESGSVWCISGNTHIHSLLNELKIAILSQF